MLKNMSIGLSALILLLGIAYTQRWPLLSAIFEARGLSEPFVGLTADGNIEPGLYKLTEDGFRNQAVIDATQNYLNTLSDDQRSRVHFPVQDDEWRKWMNVHFYKRQGISFREGSDELDAAGYALLEAGLSPQGYTLARDIMKLDTTLAELNNNNFDEYGEDLFYITVMGEPSATEPWGWQLDGHHLVINSFTLAGRAVMSPMFLGAEPVVATTGKHAGTAILQAEQAAGLAFLQALSAQQQTQAILSSEKPGNNSRAEFFSDNVIVPYQGLAGSELNPDQREKLMDLVRLYISNMPQPHAEAKLQEVAQHLDQTYFTWVGGQEAEQAYYYRVHSPVLYLEFDHQRPIGLSHLSDSDKPQRQHIHVVIRTPNGNDYGKDLLGQHLAAHPH